MVFSLLYLHVPTAATLGIVKILLELVKSRNEPSIFTKAKLKGTYMCLKDRTFNFESGSKLFLKQLP